MEENLEEKKEVKKITYEEVFEEALLSFIDEKMSKVAPDLSKEELKKAFNKIRNAVLNNQKSFEIARDKLIGEYKAKGIYDESTDPRVIETRKLMDAKSTSLASRSSNADKINFGF